MTKFYLLLIIFFIIFQASANTYYVSNSGNNKNSGLSIAAAFATLQFASDKITAGDSVLVMPGSFKGFDLRHGGKKDAPIVYKAMNAGVNINEQSDPRTDGINIEGADCIVIDGFNVSKVAGNGIRIVLSNNSIIRNNFCDHNFRGIFTSFTDDILIENNTCINSFGEHGIYFSNSGDRPIIRYNITHHNVSCGIQINADISQGGDGITTGAIIEGNIVYENGTKGGAAINLDGAQESLIYNNLIYDNHSTGLVLYDGDAAEGCANSKVYNNTIIVPNGARWGINIASSPGISIYNNIIINQSPSKGSIVIESSSLSNFQSDYNILVNRLSNTDDSSPISLSKWQDLGYDQHSKLATSLYDMVVDSSTGDYHLKSASQAINAGSSAPGLFAPYDFDKHLRDLKIDIGAYEFMTVTSVPQALTETNQYYLIKKSGEIIFQNLQTNDKIYIYDIAGRPVGEVNQHIWNIQNTIDGLYFYKIIPSSGNDYHSGKIYISN